MEEKKSGSSQDVIRVVLGEALPATARASSIAGAQSFFASPPEPPFCDGCDTLVFTFAFYGLRASLFDRCWPLAIAALLAGAKWPGQPAL